MSIDLHTHSSFSDGTDSPAQLWAAAQRAGVTTIALTDHDTTDGWAAAERTRPTGMTLIRGAELSTHLVREGRHISVHLLAYLFDPADVALVTELARLREERADRGLSMVDRMVADRVPISRTQVIEIADGAPIGRPHIGQALVRAGLVRTVTEAFATYLSGQGPYYVQKADLPLIEALRLVRHAGGVPVIAHPRARGAALILDEPTLRELRESGLAGIEVDHPDHDAAARQELRAIAERLSLIATGSSDYHGTNKPLRVGQESTSERALERIVAQSSGAVPVIGSGV